VTALTASFPMTATTDLESRTISGVCVPFGVPGHTSMGRTIVQPGAITPAAKVVLLSEHEHGKPIGLLARHEETPEGISGAFKVIGTTAGDEALLEASEGVRDGLSVGLRDVVYHLDDDGTVIVEAGTWYETSHVTFPAFDTARITQVAASQTPPAALAEDTPTQGEPVDESTAVVEATAPAYVPRARVQDAFPYRASTRDDRGMQASFFRDMLNAKNDPEAAARFDQASQMMTAANDQADVNEIIPSQYRPDLYVGQVSNLRTTIDSFSKFAIDGPNIVRIPKFNTAADLISDHTENTNPTTGSFTTTEVSLTPVAKSGMYSASREMIEGSTPAVDQLILNAIREEYALDTEAYAITTLLAGSTAGTVVDISNGVTLQVLARMVTFQANRKRAAEVFLAGSDLFVELVAQVDGSGRPMNPAVNATNAPGSVAAAAMSVSVAGLTTPYVPVLTGGVLGDRSAFATFESGLRTWRWEEKSGPAKIELAAFGYIGCAVLRPLGLLKFATQA
jgi:HK97 family phage prohead protease